jgi:hypothetical protein
MTDPLPVSLDPFRAVGRWIGKGNIQDGEHLSKPTAPADSNDPLAFVDVDAGYDDALAKDDAVKGNRKVFFDQCEQASDLLGLIETVHGRLLDHGRKPGFTDMERPLRSRST